LVIGTLFLSGGIIRLIGGVGFAESSLVLQFLVFALAFIFFGNFYNSMLIAGNLQKKLMWVLSIAAVFNVTVNYFFAIPYYSYLGAAVVSVLTELLVAGATFYLAKRELKYFPDIENGWGIVLAGIFMAISLFFLQNQNFFVAGTLSVLVYAFFLWIFKAVKAEEITSIISKKGVEEYELR
jgi:O-antigen/teichoic acid export membrane protein